ncbi:MAG: SpoIIE family protein phosphatase [Leptospiraceae bacterium]|nr:SpoIIE family protein phosphatase [Leptospiraceae bacterium]
MRIPLLILLLCLFTGCIPGSAENEPHPYRPIDLSVLEWFAVQKSEQTPFDHIPDNAKGNLHPPIALNRLFAAPPGERIVHFVIYCPFNATAHDLHEPALALHLPGVGNNWSVYLNGKLIHNDIHLNARGIPRIRRTRMRATVPIHPNDLREGENLLALHIVGEAPNEWITDDVPGLFFEQGFRIDRLIDLERYRSDSWEFALIVLFIGFGFYHLIIYFRRPQDSFNLYFSLFTLALFLYYFTRSRYLYNSIEDTEYITRTELFSLPFLTPLFLLFLDSYFRPDDYRPLWLKILMGVEAFFGVLFLITPFLYINVVYRVWLFLHLPLILILPPVYLTIVNLRRYRDALKMTLSVMVLYVTASWDMINAVFHIISMEPLFRYGFFIFALLPVVTMANRFVSAFNYLDRVNAELDRKNNALLELDRTKDIFLATTSHELRTPLHGIIGISQALKAYPTHNADPETIHQLDTIIQSAGRLTALVDEMLDISLIKTGRLKLEPHALRLKPIADQVIGILQHTVPPEGDLRLHNKIPTQLPAIHGDLDRVQQILINLTGNAIKFTRQGSVTLTAGVAGDMVEVCVADTGIGIPKHVQEKIFENFERGDHSIANRYGGTGLGLSIARDLVEKHGGAMRLESRPGEGSHFYFTLPISREDPIDLIATPPGAFERGTSAANAGLQFNQIPLVAQARERSVAAVLAVDDEPVNLQVISSLLKPAGYQVLEARNAQEALAHLEPEHHPDILLLDVMLPGMSGYEFCELVRQRYAPHELPILILTARGRIEDLVMGFQAGANDYLRKPFERMELLARVQTLLALKKATDEQQKLIALRKELNIAKQIQQSILPEIKQERNYLHIQPYYHPYDDIGGDFYEINFINANHTAIMIADVAGHGVPAALVAAMVKIAFWAAREYALEPPRFLEKMNELLRNQAGNQFVTASYVVLDYSRKMVRMASAGHVPVIIHHSDSDTIRQYKGRGRIIGWLNEINSEEIQVPVKNGDRLFLCTDGLLEIRNRDLNIVGESAFLDAIHKSKGAGPTDFNSILFKEMQASGVDLQKPFEDDLAYVAVHIKW